MHITQKSAQNIVNEMKASIHRDINIMDENGVILASTDPARRGKLHQGALAIIREGLDCLTVRQDEPERGIQRGVNLPVTLRGQLEGVIGITGEPEEVAVFGEIIRHMTEIMLEAAYQQEELELLQRSRSLFVENWLFDAQPEQVVFTMNATHALNLAIKTLVKPGGRAVISGFEHNAVLRPLHHLGAEIIVAGRRLFDPADTISAFDRAITPGTSAVICTHVSNVFGYILPVEEIAALCRARGVPFVLDASQSAGLLPVRLAELGADFIGMPGHKALYGPQGTGLLLCARMPDTLLEGGSGSASRLPDMPPELPDHAEAGTQNVCGICGLAAGLRFVRQQTPQRLLAHEIRLRRLLASMLEDIPGIRLFTGEAQSGTLSLCAAQTDCEALAARLASEGICVRAGLHCAPLAHESAGTLETGTVRFSLSAFNTEREILEIAKHIRSCLK